MEEKEKICSVCYIIKPISEFKIKRSCCKRCEKEESLMYRALKFIDDEEKVKSYLAKAYKKREIKKLKEEDPEGYKTYMIRSYKEYQYQKYGLTLSEVEEQGDFQNWECYICKIDISLKSYVDHNHETGLFRGLLCLHCNFGLGHFRDSILLLERAIDYLAERDG